MTLLAQVAFACFAAGMIIGGCLTLMYVKR